MEQGDGRQPQSCRRNNTTPRIWRKVTSSLAERPRSVPRVGDVWIPKLVVSPNHFVRLYIPGVEDLFQVGDRLLMVEHSASSSRLISYRIWRNQKAGWQFQQESIDGQSFSTFSSNFIPLKAIAEGDQSEFSN